jgi:superfamily II DNA/RNA helicase
MTEEKKSVMDGVDMLMTTHSKLRWLMEGRTLYMTNLRWLVIDEVDTLF